LVSTGQNIYYQFHDKDVRLLWHIYAENKPFLSNDSLDRFLSDAFERAYKRKGAGINKFSLNILENSTERVYATKVYLDSNMDGFVDYNDFKQVNTKKFWMNIDFHTPMSSDDESQKLWLSVYDSLEATATLSEKLIHSVWVRYSSKEDGYIYHEDMEMLLEDLMLAAQVRWPSIKDHHVEDFILGCSTRAVIAMRTLNEDDSGRVSMAQFSTIGEWCFWEKVDFMPQMQEPSLQVTDNQSESSVMTEPDLPQFEDEVTAEMVMRTLSMRSSGLLAFVMDPEDDGKDEESEQYSDKSDPEEDIYPLHVDPRGEKVDDEKWPNRSKELAVNNNKNSERLQGYHRRVRSTPKSSGTFDRDMGELSMSPCKSWTQHTSLEVIHEARVSPVLHPVDQFNTPFDMDVDQLIELPVVPDFDEEEEIRKTVDSNKKKLVASNSSCFLLFEWIARNQMKGTREMKSEEEMERGDWSMASSRTV